MCLMLPNFAYFLILFKAALDRQASGTGWPSSELTLVSSDFSSSRVSLVASSAGHSSATSGELVLHLEGLSLPQRLPVLLDVHLTRRLLAQFTGHPPDVSGSPARTRLIASISTVPGPEAQPLLRMRLVAQSSRVTGGHVCRPAWCGGLRRSMRRRGMPWRLRPRMLQLSSITCIFIQ
ncbi:unnamed protein product [Protopolystoma xenopodis]|uniref:Secreted protein n=1 Tax=Protopolystoma xenopodis TaxID=117903 RepID=A0A448WXC0_9PLAT|nr:unnamed protein product [Protopolystoma xenopodis]